MFGFLGTSIPRLLESPPLRMGETLPLVLIHVGLVACHAAGATAWGDGLMIANVLLLAVCLGLRVPGRQALPPPGFTMILPGLGCLLAALAMGLRAVSQPLVEEEELLFRLLAYHGFLLLSVLGAGGFLLPRFLGTGVRKPNGEPRPWMVRSALVFGVGLGIAFTYAADAKGRPELGGMIRAILVFGYLRWQIPLSRIRFSSAGVQWMLLCGLICLPVGILAAAWWPALRVGLGHVELVGGFSMITLAVATRIVFGHSGHRERLERFHPWLTVAGGLIVLGLLSRITGDFWPRLMLSHYVYGALCWMAGLLIWAVCVLPKVLHPDPEG